MMKKEVKMKNRAVAIIVTAAVLIMGSVIPASAASKYGEDKPLTSVKKLSLKINANHMHNYIDASNGIRYQVYHSCMDGMTGRTPTNHSDYVTIDGVKYRLCNMSQGNEMKFANVIRRVDGSSDGNSGNTNPPANTANPNPPADSGSTGTHSVALKGISLNKSRLTLTVGNAETLKVSYNPSNTTADKTVKWTTSNSKVATVSGGKITAKAKGTVSITATCSGKSAVCKVTVNAKPAAVSKEKYWNVSQAYTLTNKFRTTKKNQWYWKKDNKHKKYTYGLKKLKRDATLEKIAKKRAKEQWIVVCQRGKDSTHTRPNGQSCTTAYPKSVKFAGENLAWYAESCSEVIDIWAETHEPYKDQGHRRAMLDKKVKRIGIACYEKNGDTCWAMSLGY